MEIRNLPKQVGTLKLCIEILEEIVRFHIIHINKGRNDKIFFNDF